MKLGIRDSRWAVAVLFVLALGLLAGGAFALLREHQLRSVVAADNTALVDTGATEEVSRQVSDGLTGILTFDHTDPDKTRAVADEVLTGKARDEYDELFAALLDQSASQELTLTTQVSEVGVKRLDADSADLLVFLDQSSTRGTDGDSSVAAAQIAVTAEKRGGRWLISGLDPL